MSDEVQVISMTTPLGDEPILTDAGFHWRERSGVRVLICDALEQAGFTNGFSTRLGGVSPFPNNDLNLAGFDEDITQNIHENRRRFLAAIGGDFDLATAWQVHGDAIKIVKDDNDVRNSEEKFDGLISDLPGVLLGVKTADCVPVMMGDPKTGAFAAIHAGWRGTASSIVSKAVAKLRDVFGADSSDLVCAIGPAATCRSYEIGQDVIDVFRANFDEGEKYLSATREGHALIDLIAANRDQLISNGVAPDAIFNAPFCTMERTDLFFSYRVEKKLYGKTGRLMSVVGRRR